MRVWHADEGWGVLDSTDTPGGCWVHFSAFHGDAIRDLGFGSYRIRGGYAHLVAGETVDFDWEQVTDQDGYTFRATAARPHRQTGPLVVERASNQGGYATYLDIDLVMNESTESPDWVVAIAESLEDYVRAAVALPPADGGREPWIHMADISVTTTEEAVVVGFRWSLDVNSPQYLAVLPEAQVGADSLITRLDLALSSPTWRQRTYVVGSGTEIVTVPPRW